ncbi:MAG TPA: uridine phosphorylase [Candidatus Limnocylindrales bacterium]|jgi:uridine phosphorylase|nr:uridine phosphorylase [Candidatus Limnocylindrales bacterium]
MTLPAPDVQYHVQLRPGDVGRYVFLPGDPGRCELIARYFDDARHVAQHREYNTYTGYLNGEMVSVTSTGIGGPSTAIAVEELVRCGADTFVRVGTSGAMQEWIEPGDLGIAWAAIRDEGTSLHYLPVEFPAVADLDVTLALREGARRTGARFHLGVAQSKDSFYGQHEPQRMPVAKRLLERWSAWMAGGAICSEMEAAALYIVAATLRKRAGGIMLIAGHPDQRPMTPEELARLDLDLLIRTAIEGMKVLIEADRTRAER